MKLFSAIAAAAVIGASLVSPNPAEAFWGRGKPTYSKIMNGNNLDPYRKYAVKSGGWLHSYTNPGSKVRSYMSKIECKGSNCLYFSTSDKDDFNSVSIMQADCAGQRTKSIPSFGKDPWAEWEVFPGFKAAGKMLCN